MFSLKTKGFSLCLHYERIDQSRRTSNGLFMEA